MRTTSLLILLAFVIFSGRHLNAADKKPEPSRPIEPTKDGERWAEKTLKKLTVEEKVGQLIMIRALAEFQNVESDAYIALRDEITRYHIGSVILTVRVDGPFLLRNQPYEAAMITNRLQRESKLPLIVAADFERGLSMRLLSTPAFPHAMAFGAAGRPDYAERFGAITAREARAIGVHWNFFPVADVNSNPLNPIINTRAYGEDPQQVGDLAAAYIRGSKSAGMMTTAKHFPGHGDTDTDSHLALARVNASLERLHQVELPAFQKTVDAGVDSIMVAHVTVPALEPDPNKVATVSPNIVTGVLRNDMKFAGLIVTDAMDMRALTGIYSGDARAAAGRAAVDAVLAGNDMVLLPSDLDGAYNGLLEAAKSGVISHEALDSRVRKVLRAKAALNLHKDREIELDHVANFVGQPADMAFAQEVADSAVVLAKNGGAALNLLSQERARFAGTSGAQQSYESEVELKPRENGTLALVFTDDVRSDWGRTFQRELRRRIPDANIIFLDPRFAPYMLEPITEAALNAKAVIVSAFSIPVAGGREQGIGLQKDSFGVIDRIIRVAAGKTVVIALGNPYLAKDIPGIQTYLCTFSHVPTSETAAIKALFGEIPLRGKLPVSIPGFAQRGAGLERTTVAVSASQQ